MTAANCCRVSSVQHLRMVSPAMGSWRLAWASSRSYRVVTPAASMVPFIRVAAKSAISRVSPQSLNCSATASFNPRQSPRHIFEGAALHHAHLVPQPFGIFRAIFANCLTR